MPGILGITVFNSYIIVTQGMIIKHGIIQSKPSLTFKGYTGFPADCREMKSQHGWFQMFKSLCFGFTISFTDALHITITISVTRKIEAVENKVLK